MSAVRPWRGHSGGTPRAGRLRNRRGAGSRLASTSHAAPKQLRQMSRACCAARRTATRRRRVGGNRDGGSAGIDGTAGAGGVQGTGCGGAAGTSAGGSGTGLAGRGGNPGSGGSNANGGSGGVCRQRCLGWRGWNRCGRQLHPGAVVRRWTVATDAGWLRVSGGTERGTFRLRARRAVRRRHERGAALPEAHASLSNRGAQSSRKWRSRISIRTARHIC